MRYFIKQFLKCSLHSFKKNLKKKKTFQDVFLRNSFEDPAEASDHLPNAPSRSRSARSERGKVGRRATPSLGRKIEQNKRARNRFFGVFFFLRLFWCFVLVVFFVVCVLIFYFGCCFCLLVFFVFVLVFVLLSFLFVTFFCVCVSMVFLGLFLLVLASTCFFSFVYVFLMVLFYVFWFLFA